MISKCEFLERFETFIKRVASYLADFLDYLPKIMIDFKTSFGDSFIQGEVTNVNFEGKVVSLASGKSVNYTDLVIAVGNTGPFPSIPNDNQNAQADFTDACRQLSQEVQ